MAFPALNLTAALLAASAYANSFLPSENLILRSADVLHKPYAAILARSSSAPVVDYLEAGIPVLRARQQSNDNADENGSNSPGGLNATEPGIVLNPDRSLNFTAWSMAVNPACAQSLSKLKQSTNPSGACVCYNVIALDMTDWRFEADLRLFEVSPSRGDFAGIPVQAMGVVVNYNGAEADGQNLTTIPGVREGAPNSGPRLNQVYRIKGQIDRTRIILMPNVTLRAINGSGEVSTPVSANEASFLAGVFSSQSVMSDFSAAQLAVDKSLEALKNGTIAFVLPGTQIMIFPIGLIITCAWLIIGLAAYGFGTFERMQYAEMYKNRQARTGKSSSTI
ncbi:hypothetical protein NLU13_3675 [Sarocladium strictum]|uniref:Uncharacterized protein n=1 Tax=Sarocladium strictum TaxID=5046 RepID=A0AA39GQ77_SARSR|nr:hypothetical protein NLU13_3675 [Sarocladium strictum]